MSQELPQRKLLVHTPPTWIPQDSLFFITICCQRRGANSLASPTTFQKLVDSIDYRAKLLQWNPHLVMIMPDHFHGFFTFSSFQEMKKTVSDWKRFTARTLVIDWQRDFFDHRVRNNSELQEKWSYVLMNPVRAGLCEKAEDWEFRKKFC